MSFNVSSERRDFLKMHADTMLSENIVEAMYSLMFLVRISLLSIFIAATSIVGATKWLTKQNPISLLLLRDS